jgi:hypothetical protein
LTVSDSILFDVPNLDDLSVDPDDYDRAAAVMATLADYSKTKARAVRARAAGLIDTAILRERECEAIYQRLPGWARW